MKLIVSFLLVFGACFPPVAKGDLDSNFSDSLSQIEAKYCVGKAALIKEADRVIIYIVDFDRLADGDVSGFGDENESIAVAPYGKRAKILSTKVIETDDRKNLLEILSPAIARPEHTGGAFCHFPIHGIRIYSGDELLHEGTFCWVCGNFSFSYPQGSGWSDTNAALKAIFMKLAPIPQAELDRFRKMYPGAEAKGEKPATRHELKLEGGDKPRPEAEARPQ